MQQTLGKIEKLRIFMHYQGMQKGMKHPDVLKISQELDVLLNKYYHMSL